MRLNEREGKRLEEWRKSVAEKAKPKINHERHIGRGVRNDHGDVMTQEQWDEEIRLSQRRR